MGAMTLMLAIKLSKYIIQQLCVRNFKVDGDNIVQIQLLAFDFD